MQWEQPCSVLMSNSLCHCLAVGPDTSDSPRLVSTRLAWPGLARERDCVRREGLDKWPRGVCLLVQGADGHVGCTARAELHVEHGLDDWHNIQ